MILVSIYTYGFFNRLQWMLKSIEEQSIKVNTRISIFKDDPYLSNDFMKNNEQFSFKIYEDMNFFSQRHNIRNEDLKYSFEKYDHICFMDSDIIIDKNFFEEIVSLKLEETKVINVPRDEYDCEIADMNSLVKNIPENNCSEYFKSKFSTKISNRCIGGGYFQMVDTKYCNKNKINYCGHDRPITNKNGQKAYSDKQFRKQFGGVQKIRNMENRLYHLHHEKGNGLTIGCR